MSNSNTGDSGGDVTAGANITDNAVVRGDGGAKGIQGSGVTLDDSDKMSGLTQLDLTHTAAEADDHALEIDCDAAGFGDVKALDIVYTTGAITAVQDEEAILLNIDESASTGGIFNGYEVLTTAEGSATINGYTTGININPIVHESGTFGDADDILNKAVDVTAALASGGAGNISIFVADDDTITIGDAATWDEFEIILGTGASGGGIAPTFEYSTGGAAFSTFSPADGTNGFRNTGAILWDSASLAGWATATSGRYEIRITRTKNSLSTTPIIDELQISSTTEYTWDKNGDVTVKSISLTDDLTVANGGTGRSSHTAYAVLCGGTTTTAAQQSIAGVGSSGQVLTSNGAGALPTFQAASGGYDVSNFSGGKMYICDEFMDTGTDHSLGWSVSSASGGGSGTVAISQHYGTIKLTRGTTATGSSMYYLPNAFYPDLPFKFGFYMQIPTLSDGTNRFDVEMGVSKSTTSAGATSDGLYFRYVDDENSAKWLVNTEKDGVATSSDSGITADTDFHYFEIEADASWTNISFYIDGVETSNSPSTTNIPATTDFMYFFFRLQGSDGTTDRQINYDRFYMITNP